MRLGGGGDDQRVAGVEQGRERQGGRAAGLAANRGGAGGVRIVDADELGSRRRRHLQRVVAAEMPGPGDADAQARPSPAGVRVRFDPMPALPCDRRRPGSSWSVPRPRATAPERGCIRRVAPAWSAASAEEPRPAVMMYYSRQKMAAVLAVCLLGLLLCVPNVMRSPGGGIPWRQIHLGLDLRGGSYLLMRVDLDALARERLETLTDQVRQALLKAGLRLPHPRRRPEAGGGDVRAARPLGAGPRPRHAAGAADRDAARAVGGDAGRRPHRGRAVAGGAAGAGERGGVAVDRDRAPAHRRHRGDRSGDHAAGPGPHRGRAAGVERPRPDQAAARHHGEDDLPPGCQTGSARRGRRRPGSSCCRCRTIRR